MEDKPLRVENEIEEEVSNLIPEEQALGDNSSDQLVGNRVSAEEAFR